MICRVVMSSNLFGVVHWQPLHIFGKTSPHPVVLGICTQFLDTLQCSIVVLTEILSGGSAKTVTINK